MATAITNHGTLDTTIVGENKYTIDLFHGTTITNAPYFDIPEFLFYETLYPANDLRPYCPIIYSYLGTSSSHFDNLDFNIAISGTKGTSDAVYRATLKPSFMNIAETYRLYVNAFILGSSHSINLYFDLIIQVCDNSLFSTLGDFESSPQIWDNSGQIVWGSSQTCNPCGPVEYWYKTGADPPYFRFSLLKQPGIADTSKDWKSEC